MKSVAASCLAVLLAVASAAAQPWTTGSFDPSWATVPPANIVRIDYNNAMSAAWNGQQLFNALTGLTPAQDLAIGPGTWLLPSTKLSLAWQGTTANPVWIHAANPASKPVLMRANTGNVQNVINVGERGPARYVGFRNLDITHQVPVRAGADLIKLYDCANVWIDRCYIHDGGGVGIAANSRNSSFLYITRNEIARPGPTGTTGEGMYLGANNGTIAMHDSIVALNHVHDTSAASQGDGIEVKEGSYRNWIVQNHVHRTRYPCIIAYGTRNFSTSINLIERNLMYDCMDNVLQVQGDAIVRNNVAIYTRAGGGSAFQSHAHQGSVRRLTVVHNTFVNVGRAANLSSWNNAPSMVFANNACYSQTSSAMRFANGSGGVTVRGNVVFGGTTGVASGFFRSTAGLPDFVDTSWNATTIDVTPVVGSELDNHGAAAFNERVDITGAARFFPADPGARENALAAKADTYAVSAATGGTQRFTFAGGARLANRRYLVLGSLSGIAPSIPLQSYELSLAWDFWFTNTVLLPNQGILRNTSGVLDASGNAPAGATRPRLVVPPLPGVVATAWHAFGIYDGGTGAIHFVSNPVPLSIR